MHQTYDTDPLGRNCQSYGNFFGAMGAMFALVLTSVGAAYGMAKAAEGICKSAVNHPRFIMKSMIPIVMAGIGPIYGLVVGVMISDSSQPFGAKYPTFKGFVDLGAGIAVGVSGIAGGYAMGICGDSGVRMSAQSPKAFTAMILVCVFAGAPLLMGLIVALSLNAVSTTAVSCHSVPFNPCCTDFKAMVAYYDQNDALWKCVPDA